MNKVVLLALIGAMAFATEGCTFFSQFNDARKELEEETAKPIPVQVNTAQNQTKPEEEVFADLEEEEVEPLPEIAGLIPATDPEARVRSSVRGRNDPFSVVNLNPRIEIEEREERNSNTTANRNNNRNINSDRARTSNNTNNSNSPIQDLPQPEEFEPTLARDVVVSGLFQANGRTRIIVQAPDESSSRYVEVGQYLSNGQILVKRIDASAFPGPTIILEQAGVEVAKTIGEDLEEDTVSSGPPSFGYDLETAVSLK